MRHEFVNQVPVPISAEAPATIESAIVVTGLDGAEVQDIEVMIDITHTWAGDLRIILVSPDNKKVVLAERRGSSRDDFRGTIFRADAQTPIAEGSAPFRGTFRPDGDLTAFTGGTAGGSWTLIVEDMADQDGGALNRWSIGLTTTAVEASPFNVTVRFLGGLSPRQQEAFASAAARWSQIITGDLPPAMVEGELVDDVLIEAEGIAIDGPGAILGQAGPRFVRPGTMLPIKGKMSFDTADLDRMEQDNSLEDVILHEMGHVIGFGTLWGSKQLIQAAGTVNPIFIGTNAMREYGRLRAIAEGIAETPTAVPVANTGGPGTRDGHWREAVFGDELLTGFLSGASRPISAMSIACFEDMGYRVDYGAAEAYQLPSLLMLAEMGILGERHHEDSCTILFDPPTVLPPSAMEV